MLTDVDCLVSAGKTPDGKPLNEFGYEGKAIGAAEAIAVVEETHEQWRALVDGEVAKGKLWTG